MIDIMFLVFGAMVGSFLNVCIVRLPLDKSVVFPASHCVHCKKSIAWYDNVPIISWLVLQGKCRHCEGPISVRYWVVELAAALIFWGFYRYFGLSPLLLPYLVMAGCFMVAVFVDFAHRIIPDQVTVGGMAVGIVLSALIPALHPEGPTDAALGTAMAGTIVLVCMGLTFIYPFFCKHLMEDDDPAADRPVKILVISSLLASILINAGAGFLPARFEPYAWSLSAALSGFIVGGGLVYAMGLVGDIVFKKESMGGGDVKLMAMVGAFMGWKLAILSFFLAPFFGAAYGIAEKIRTKDSTIAYGPFLVMGALVSLFWGHAIIRWVMNGGIYGL